MPTQFHTEISMLTKEEITQFLRKSCPNIWSTLNREARHNPSKGFQEFLSGNTCKREWGEHFLQIMDNKITQLIQNTSQRLIGDKYRRDLSGANSEKKLAELFCEISLVESLTKISLEAPLLRPRNESGTECDVKVVIEGVDLYADSKRLVDRWKGGRRSIAKSPPEYKPTDCDRPRSMDLYSKLKDVPRQFPNNTINVVFLFHPSKYIPGENQRYIEQALLGENSLSSESYQMTMCEDGLYSLPEWKKISACCYSYIDYNGTLSIINTWKNPNAAICISDIIIHKLRQAFPT